jgi:hypothetical protein
MLKTEFAINPNYLRIVDALRIQNMAKNLFENFDGGFGIFDDRDYFLRQHIDEKEQISLGFTGKKNYWDLYYEHLGDRNPKDHRTCFRVTVETALFEICKKLKVHYSPDRHCVTKCVEECKKLKIPIQEFKEPEVK